MANYTPIQEGMKGIVVANVTNTNFAKIWERLYQLQAENEELKKTAMIGNNGTSGITNDAVVNVMYNPQTIIAKTEDEDSDYYVDVKVMCGQRELTMGEDNPRDFTFEATCDDKITEAGMIANITRIRTDENKLRLKVTVKPGAISDGSFDFYIKYNKIKYNYTVNVVVINTDLNIEYAQGVFMSTIFKRGDAQPETPQGGNFNIPLPVTLSNGIEHQGWTDGIPVGTKPLWTSHRKFTNNGKAPQDPEWSVPILAMDSADFDVCFTSGTTGGDVPNPPLHHGDQDAYEDPEGWHNIGNEFDVWMATSVKNGNDWGPWSIVKIKGEDGSMSDWKNTIYKASPEQPATPTADDPDDFVDNPDAVAPNDGWHDVPNDNGTWWMSCGYVNGDTGKVAEWSTPVLVAGGTGQGVFVSHVFMRSLEKPNRPVGGDYGTPLPDGGQWQDGIPDGNENAAPVWTSHSTFTSDGMPPQTSGWSDPVMLVDTADFDCCFTAYEGVPGAPQRHGDQSEYTDPYGWHNDGTSDDIWMATSSKPANSTQWSDWVITKIKGESGVDGNYTSYIFKSASGNTIDAPTVTIPENFIDKDDNSISGNTGQPIRPGDDNYERNRGWKDGPGIDYENDNLTWWMSCGVIDGSTGRVMGDGWSKPIPMDGRDGASTEYRYGINDSEVDPPSMDLIGDDTVWSDTVAGALHIQSVKDGVTPDYTTVPSNHYMWMAMRRSILVEGVLTPQNWEYCRVTGEKGESGTQLKVKDTKDSYEELFLVAVNSDNTPRATLPEDGDTYVVNKDMWVWSDAADWVHSDSDTEAQYDTALDPAKWRNCGPIVGPSGATPFFHVKYAKALTLSAETENHEIIWFPNEAFNSADGCRYIGTRVDLQKEAVDDPQYYSGYTWAQFTGQDGYGYEYIYKLSNTNPAQFTVPTKEQCTPYDGKTFDDNDYVPSGWTDNPTGISTLYPYEFMASRIRENGVWQPFKGQPSSNRTPILYSYRGKDLPYEERQWHAFQSLVLTDAMKNATDWQNTIPNANVYQHDYIWQRTRTVTPAYGSQTADTRTEWEYLRVSGEKGNVGTGIQLNGTCTSLDELFRLAYDGNTYNEHKLSGGTAYTVSGDLWVWNEANDDILSPNTDEHGNHIDYGTNIPCHHWRNGGQIKGEASHIHIKYAKVASAVTESVSGVQVTKYYVLDNDWLTTKITPGDGELPGKYIGICYNNTEEDPDPIPEGGGLVSPYSWTIFQGEDGLDYEMIYTRTSGSTAPPVPHIAGNLLSGNTTAIVADEDAGFNADGTPKDYKSKYYTEADFIPCYKAGDNGKTTLDEHHNPVTYYNWTDNPMGTTEQLPYEWAAKRDKINGIWTDFYGRADSTNDCVLYNKYGRSSMEINIPNGQYIYYPTGSDGCANQVDKVIEFVVSKDGQIQTVSSISFSDVSITNDGSPSTSGMSNFFSTYSGYTTGGSHDCPNPHLYLINKRFKLNDQYQYSFTCTLNINGQDYKKTFYFQLEPKGQAGPAGLSIVEYSIAPDKTTLKMNSAGQLDMDVNDGISIVCSVKSGDTVTRIDFQDWDNTKYGLYYQLDNGTPQNVSTDSRAGGDGRNGFVSKAALEEISRQVTIMLTKKVNGEDVLVQSYTIPTVYDGQGGSRTNLFGRENPFWMNAVATGCNSQIMHTSDGFAAWTTTSSITQTIWIEDNPYETYFETGECYIMTCKVRVKQISNCRYLKLYDGSDGGGIRELDLGNDWSGWVDVSQRITNYNPGHNEYQHFRIKYTYGNNDTAYRNKWSVLIEAKRMKIEHLPSSGMPATGFDGLAMGHPVQNNNLFQGSSVFKVPFTRCTDSRYTITRIEPYAYCGNHALVAYKTSSENKSILGYKTSVTTGKYYTVSWYQKTWRKEASYSNGSIRFTVTGNNGTLPNQCLLVCSEDGPVYSSLTNSLSATTNHDLADDWKRHSVSFYCSSSNTDTENLELDWYYNPVTIGSGHTVYISMPKFEESDFPSNWVPNDADKVGKPLRGPRNWEIGEVYQAGGIDDDFQDIVISTNQDVMYLCKYTHTSDNSNNPDNAWADNGWTVNRPWAKTQKVAFVASDVIWTNSLQASLMRTIDANIDDLTVGKMSTEQPGGATVNISGGTMQIAGRNGQVNIEIGINDNGEAVLKFYDQYGHFKYDLGPTAILSGLDRCGARYSKVPDLYRLNSDGAGNISALGFNSKFACNLSSEIWKSGSVITAVTVTSATCYEFHDGSVNIQNLTKYTTWLDSQLPTDQTQPGYNDPFSSTTHSEYHEKLFGSSGSTTEHEPDTGRYVAPNGTYSAYVLGSILSPEAQPSKPQLPYTIQFYREGVAVPGMTLPCFIDNYSADLHRSQWSYYLWVRNAAGEYHNLGIISGAQVNINRNITFQQVYDWTKTSTPWAQYFPSEP